MLTTIITSVSLITLGVCVMLSIYGSVLDNQIAMGVRLARLTGGTNLQPANGKLPTRDHYRAMSRIRARLWTQSEIDTLATFRARAKMASQLTDQVLRNEALQLLNNFTKLADAFGDACKAANDLETKTCAGNRQKALTSQVLASVDTMTSELNSILLRQDGSRGDYKLEVMNRFVEQRYGNGPKLLSPKA